MPVARRSARTRTSASTRDASSPYARADSRFSSSASIARATNNKTSLRLTVKAPPSKLRQATSGSQIPPNPYADGLSESDATPAPPRRAARTTRNPRVVVDPDSDELDDEPDAEGELEDEEPEGDGDEDMLGPDDSDEDAEGEDDDMDELQEDHPPPPVIKDSRKGKPNVTVSGPLTGPLKSVEDKEMEDDDDDDDELSELDSLDEEPNEGEGGDDDEEEEEEEEDSDGENSRSATPDLAKLTKRQRGAVEFENVDLLALSNEAQKKKHLTAEEHAMRRAEMARRRKNLSEKRNEEEKMETINKLLHKQAPKRRTRQEIEAARAAEAGEDPEEDYANRADPTFLRWVSSQKGSVICVSHDWLASPAGDMLRKPGHAPARKMVEEVS